MSVLWIVTGMALAASFVANRRKTILGLRRAWSMLKGVLPLLLGVLAVVGLVLAAVPPATLTRILGGQGLPAFLFALVVGSIALTPGFVAFPLASMLRENGAGIGVLAAFVTSLLMVGVLTLPVEIRFFGRRIALMRNALAFAGSALVAVLMILVLR
jgi:uncharacterized membrane protein YraQ (UPF0718 family)